MQHVEAEKKTIFMFQKSNFNKKNQQQLYSGQIGLYALKIVRREFLK